MTFKQLTHYSNLQIDLMHCIEIYCTNNMVTQIFDKYKMFICQCLLRNNFTKR